MPKSTQLVKEYWILDMSWLCLWVGYPTRVFSECKKREPNGYLVTKGQMLIETINNVSNVHVLYLYFPGSLSWSSD